MVLQRSGILVIGIALWLSACFDQDSRYTEPSLSCLRCSLPNMAAGDSLEFRASWQGMAQSSGYMHSEERFTCDPFRVHIACSGVACETTRNGPDGDFWPLAQAALLEGDWGCSSQPDTFEVRPVEGGVLTGTVTLHNMSTGETEALPFGPIEVRPPVVAPRATCDGCGDYDRLGLGVPIDVRVRWDGEVGDGDPVGRQPFTVDIDCGEVSCEAQLDRADGYAPLQPIVVPVYPASRGANLRLRATEPGDMQLTARLEHADTGEVVVIDLATIEHHRVNSLAILCLDGQLCDGEPEQNPSMHFGVVGLAETKAVLIEPAVRYTSNVESTPQGTICSPEPYVDALGAEGWACTSRLYEFEDANQFTIYAEWMGMTAELTAPAP